LPGNIPGSFKQKKKDQFYKATIEYMIKVEMISINKQIKGMKSS